MCPSPGSKPSPGSLTEAGKLFLKHTTLHGLRHIFLSGSYPRRVAWLLAFLAAVALFFTWSSNRVRYLLTSPMYTKAHMVYAKRLVFPAVTICNQNLLLPRRMKKTDIFSSGRWLGLLEKEPDSPNLQVSPAAKEALLTLLGDGAGSAGSEPPWLSRILDFKNFLPPPLESQPSMKQLLDRLGHQLEEMLLYCRYQGELCGPRNFSTVSVSPKSLTFPTG
ncbi:PREDICTED: acid-sensing ion channel 2-like [Cyprinodon variegatus]|uniref:acid-sensing ion channel 2-like n=1 Tax=Cyprinodon variegatus TaxID=28743 RepID=UPI00074264C4|nr:PREDICTED: acid-sensing ion channel 2-like [Cyprinodon variegatus]